LILFASASREERLKASYQLFDLAPSPSTLAHLEDYIELLYPSVYWRSRQVMDRNRLKVLLIKQEGLSRENIPFHKLLGMSSVQIGTRNNYS
jgi:hypothetical protein